MRAQRGAGVFTRLLLFAGLLLCPAGVARAQGSEAPTGLDLSDEFALLAEEDVVVSAIRHAQRIEESPSAITVITREEILAGGYATLGDVMRRVPGADVSRIGPLYWSVGLRSGTTAAGDLLLVRIDGRDVALPMHGLPVWPGIVAVEDIERVEVIRGPASTLYGPNALQGVVNVITRRSAGVTARAEASLTTEAGSATRLDASAHGTLGGVNYWISGGGLGEHALDDASRTGGRVYRGRARAGLPLGGLTASLEAGWNFTEGSMFSSLGDTAFTLNWPYLSARLEGSDSEVQLIAEQVRLVGSLDMGLVMLGTNGAPDTLLGTFPTLTLTSTSVDLQAHHGLRLFEGNRFTAGVNLRGIHHVADGGVICPAGVSFEDYRREDCSPLDLLESRLGAFVQDEWRLTDQLQATLGLRADAAGYYGVATASGSKTSWIPLALSPRVALVWLPSTDHAFRAGFGRAYRKPAFLETFTHSFVEPGPDAPAEVVRRLDYAAATGIGNLLLENEKSSEVEAGWRGGFLDGVLALTVDGYHRVHEDGIRMIFENFELQPGFGGIPTIPADAWAGFMNDPTPWVSWGGEASVDVRPLRWVSLGINYMYNRSWRTEVDAAGVTQVLSHPYEPDHRLNGFFRLEPAPGLMVSVDAYWASWFGDELRDPRSLLTPRVWTPAGASTLVNAGIRYRFPWDGGQVDVSLLGTNVLGLDIREGAGRELEDGSSYGVQRLARRVDLSLRMAWDVVR